MDFGDLKEDKTIQTKLQNFNNSVSKIDKILDQILNDNIYESLTIKEKVDYDLFVAYTLNTLFWLYVRSKGEDPNKHEIKDQLNRIKEYMVKAKAAHERNTLRPKVDKPAAARFIKHGLKYKGGGQPANKKRKFEDSD